MSQSKENEIAYLIRKKMAEVNDLVLQAVTNGLLVHVSVIKHNDIMYPEPIPALMADIWTKL